MKSVSETAHGRISGGLRQALRPGSSRAAARAFGAALLLNSLALTAGAADPDQGDAAARRRDAGLYAAYQSGNSFRSLYFSVCGRTLGSEGCYGGASLYPNGVQGAVFGKIGAFMESGPVTQGSRVTRYIYVLDIAAGKNKDAVVLHVFRRLDLLVQGGDRVSAEFVKAIRLRLKGGADSAPSMAASDVAIFVGTQKAVNVVRISKKDLSVSGSDKLAAGSVLSITSDPRGYVSINYIREGSVEFAIRGPDDTGGGGGGGVAYMADNRNATLVRTLARTPAATAADEAQASGPSLAGRQR